MANQDWQRYIPPDGSFEVWLPAKAQLQEYAGTPAGETYLYWTPERGAGTFSIFRQSKGVGPATDMIELEKSHGAVVSVETDEQIERDGTPARHLRFRSTKQRPRQLEIDPETGLRRHTGGDQKEEIAEFIFMSHAEETISAGYRLNVAAAAQWLDIFQEMLDRFRLLKPA